MEAENGQAEVRGAPRVNAESAEAEGRLRAYLPADAFVIEHTLSDRIRLEHARAYVNVSDLDLSSPIVDGRFTELEGRLADGPDEVVVTGALLDELDLSLGDRITPQVLDRELTIVGRVDRLEYDDVAAFVDGGVPVGAATSTQVFVDLDRLPSAVPSVRGWRFGRVGADGWYSGDDTSTGLFWNYLAGAVALLVVGTVIAAAFAVGARRQLHSIGLLSSAGASSATVRWFLLAQGLVTGAVGSTLGVVLGVGATRVVPEWWIESFLDRPVDGPITRWADLLPILVIGTLAAVGAAWVPARTAARVPTLQALAGRRPQARVPTRLPAVGVLAVGGGAGLLALAVAASREAGDDTITVLVAVAGSVSVLVGTLAIGPWVVGALERVSGRWPEAGRLAGRSLARSRLRSAAVVGALCAMSATLVAGSSVLETRRDQDRTDDLTWIGDDQVVLSASETFPGRDADIGTTLDRLAAQVRDELPDAAVLDIPDAVHVSTTPAEPHSLGVGSILVGGEGDGWFGDGANAVGIATPAWLDLLGVPDDLRSRLDAGEAVVVGDAEGVTEISIARTPTDPTPASIPFGGSLDSSDDVGALPRVLIGPDRASDLGLVLRKDPRVLFQLDRPLTGEERDTLSLLADDANWSADGNQPVYVDLYVAGESSSLSPSQVRAIGYGTVLLLVGAVVAVGLALAAKDNEDENQVLVAVGAAPRVVRRVGALRAGLLVASATVIAVPAGLLSAWAMVAASESSTYVGATGVVQTMGHRLHPDWITLGFVSLALPIGVMAVALFGSWLRDVVRRPRPDVFAFAD
jgi:putative ABC transport system permease protein